jgi:diacylglycerol kinase
MSKGRFTLASFWVWLRKRAMSFVCAGRGVALLCLTQANFRIHIAASICAIALGWLFWISAIEWLILLLTIALVLTTEALNTVLEKTVDLCQPESHPAARDAKDLSAAAVLIASAGALIVGVILFGPRVARLLTG